MLFFGLKYAQDSENWAAYPHQEFPVVPASGLQEQGVNHAIIIIAQKTLDDSFWLLFTYVSNPTPLNTAFLLCGMPLH